MLPAVAYTSPDVLAWERRQVFAGTWACLGRLDELLPEGTPHPTSRAGGRRPAPADARRRRAAVREHVPAPRPRAAADGVARDHAGDRLPVPRLVLRPGRPVVGGPGVRRGRRVRRGPTVWSSCRCGAGAVGSSGTLNPVGAPRRPAFDDHVGALAGSWRRTAGDAPAGGPARLRGRGELEGDRRELPRVLPLPGHPPRAVPRLARRLGRQLRPARRAGSAARCGCATGWQTMSLDGESRGGRSRASPRPPWSTSTCCPTCWSRRTRTT